jgi:hypothetical protein
MSQMKRLKSDKTYYIAAPAAQLVENLLGKTGNHIVLEGSWIENENETLAEKADFLGGWLPRFKIYACMFFTEFEAGAKLVVDLGGIGYIHKNLRGIGGGAEFLPFGLCCYVMAKRSRKNKYKNAANHVRLETQSLVKRGCLNLIHALSLLDAEYYALRGNIARAKECYSRSIVEASRAGFRQNAAVAHERYSDFLISIDNPSEATYHIRKSIELHKEWGATGVVDHLSKHYQSLLA